MARATRARATPARKGKGRSRGGRQSRVAADRASGGIWRRVRRLLTGPLGLVLLVVALGWYLSLDLADLRQPQPGDRRPAITLLDREGSAFARYGDHYGRHLTLGEMSPWLPEAVVAIEDRRFYQHPGIDPIGIGRALIQNLQAGRVVQGGSTISQQLAKLAFLTPERTFVRKVKEALYTLWIELRFDKNEILEAYLDRVYLGSGSYGVEAAARRYFAKSAADLSLAESAMLAGLIQAPSRYAPTRDLALARERAGVVLDAMVEVGAVDAGTAAAAKARPTVLAAPPTRSGSGYFADWVLAESRLYADSEQPEIAVRTSLDQAMQRAAETAVTEVLAAEGGRAPDQVALVAMTHDGRVRAMLGGRSYADSQFNRATQAERQPGSAFKLFVYLAALESGLRPADRISAAPITLDDWQPRNVGDAYPAEISLIDAFADSVNTAAVRLAEQVGRERVIEMAERLGITSPLRDDPSLALGSSEVRLIELTAAYATIANGGYLVWPEAIEVITGADGTELHRRRPVDEPVVEPAVVRASTAMLEAAVRRGTGRQAALRRFVAGKTGTSSENRDAWFVGFTDALVVGVWVGNDDGRPMVGIAGGNLPAQIFRAFVLRAQGDEPFRPAPPPPKPGRGFGEMVDDLIGSIKRLFGD